MINRFTPLRAVALGVAMTAILAASALAGVTIPVAGDPVTIDTGKVSGTLLDPDVKAYFGIPFAAPPVRELRWHAPMPAKPWNGIYTADQKRAECVQPLRSSSINHYFGEEDAAEDCLYLNLWAPAHAGAKLPVVVWIYGGAFVIGSASSPIYDGSALARKGVIYVAANYRLGVMGFLAHPEASRESGHNASSDWGFLDQIAALQWVRRNIAAFGGDPDNVTLVGQSAGSASINDLQASPLAKGLFERGIGMSAATVAGGAGDHATLAAAEAQGLKLQAALKVGSLAEMRSLSSEKIVAAAQQAGIGAGPTIDGYFLPDTPEAIFRAGKQNDVAVITGSTANDMGTDTPIRRATTLADYRAAAKAAYGDKVDAFLKLYPASTNAQARAQAELVGRESGFGLGARQWVRAQTATGKQPAYLYLVSRVQPFTPGVAFSDFDPKTAGAYHMSDVPYWLGDYDAFNLFRTTRDWTPYDRELSNIMQDVVVHFARTGDPSTDAVKMVRYDPAHEQLVEFGDSIKVDRLNTKGMDFLLAMSAPAAAPPASPPKAAAQP